MKEPHKLHDKIIQHLRAKNEEIELGSIAYRLVSIRINLEKIKAEYKFVNPDLYFAASGMLTQLDEFEKLYKRKKE